ncbi:MAG: magnesium transporter [Planctomycetes bacterium]|nr:magnesium transporter [Planctomycetota bacterium]MCA8936647.1 magnesium transporter [Planctomycetota bacterium]
MALARLITPEVEEMLRTGDYTGFRALSEHLHPADMAELIESVPTERLLVAFLAVARDRQPEVFEYLDPNTQTLLLDEFKPDVMSRLLNDLSDDVRTELLVELPGQVTRRLLETLGPDERKRALALLGYPPDSAGRLMTPEFLHINANATAADVLAKVRKLSGEVETVYVIYVIDSGSRLLGTVSLRDVVIAKEDERVHDFMTENIKSVHAHDDREDVLAKLREYDLLAVPVVDSQDRLVGIVTFDDLSDVHEDEATEDILKMHGVVTEQDDYFTAGLFKRFRSRVIWLVALAVVGTGSVLVQQAYNPIISQLSLLAAYITLLTASGGNVGTQSAGILIRAVSTDDMDRSKLKKIFFGEILIGMALAATLAVIGTVLVLVRGAEAQVLGGHDVTEVATIVGISMFMAVLTTNTLGAAIPIIMRRINVDPAVTAGPFITTAADILTVLVYFNIAQAVILD